jgi:hypothetical protein
MIAKVAGFLRSLHEHGLLQIDNLELAAEQLIASWLGLCQLQQSLGIANPLQGGDLQTCPTCDAGDDARLGSVNCRCPRCSKGWRQLSDDAL